MHNIESCGWDGGDCCNNTANTDFCSACECLEQDRIASRKKRSISHHLEQKSYGKINLRLTSMFGCFKECSGILFVKIVLSDDRDITWGKHCLLLVAFIQKVLTVLFLFNS